MSLTEGKYNIKAITKILGIQAGTLRAWERRYQIIAPIRNDAGHRLYSDEHVRILRWLMEKVNNGFTISQAIHQLDHGGMNHEVIVGAQSFKMECANKLFEALINFDERTAYESLNHAFSLFSVENVVNDILVSVLVKIGDLFEKGDITRAHEYFASSFIRTKIATIMQTLPVSSFYPKAVAVCAPNESNEAELLVFTLYLRQKGFEVIYFGAGIVLEDIEQVLKEVKPKFLFISCTTIDNIPATLRVVERLRNNETNMEIGLGGRASILLEPLQRKKFAEHSLGRNQSDWDSWLELRL